MEQEFAGLLKGYIIGLLTHFPRTLGLMLLLPLSTSALSVRLRTVISLALSTCLMERSNWEFRDLLLHFFPELLLGALIALPTRLIVVAVQTGGVLIDASRGQSFGSMINPLADVTSDGMASFGRWYVLLVLVSAGVFEGLFVILVESGRQVPLGSGLVFLLDQTGSDLIELIVQCFQIALLFILPWMTSFLIVHVWFGMLSKMIPRIMLLAESFQMKTCFTLALLVSAHRYFSWERLMVELLDRTTLLFS